MRYGAPMAEQMATPTPGPHPSRFLIVVLAVCSGNKWHFCATNFNFMASTNFQLGSAQKREVKCLTVEQPFDHLKGPPSGKKTLKSFGKQPKYLFRQKVKRKERDSERKRNPLKKSRKVWWRLYPLPIINNTGSLTIQSNLNSLLSEAIGIVLGWFFFHFF